MFEIDQTFSTSSVNRAPRYCLCFSPLIKSLVYTPKHHGSYALCPIIQDLFWNNIRVGAAARTQWEHPFSWVFYCRNASLAPWITLFIGWFSQLRGWKNPALDTSFVDAKKAEMRAFRLVLQEQGRWASASFVGKGRVHIAICVKTHVSVF